MLTDGRWYGECKSRKHKNNEGCARQDLIKKELSEYFNQLIAPSPVIIAWVKMELRQFPVSGLVEICLL